MNIYLIQAINTFKPREIRVLTIEKLCGLPVIVVISSWALEANSSATETHVPQIIVRKYYISSYDSHTKIPLQNLNNFGKNPKNNCLKIIRKCLTWVFFGLEISQTIYVHSYTCCI